jgi:RNA polymerase sigma-70 factor (ECF subfamily)
MAAQVPGEVTEALARVCRGEEAAAADLLPVVYQELRALAGSCVKRGGPEDTLQPTALVHEVFLKLARPVADDWDSRAHFFAVAAKAMRQILVDHARRKKAAKRGGGWHRVTLSGLLTPPTLEQQIDLIALDEALTKLATLSRRQYQVVELRFLAGLSENDVARVLGLTRHVVQREWRAARAFLRCELSGDALP